MGTPYVRGLLLTWNPGPHDDRRFSPAAWRAEMVRAHRVGEAVVTTWGVARHRHGFEPGQPTLLYRQGAFGRGLVARGVLLEGPRPDPERARGIVDVEWRSSVPVEDALPVPELEAVSPGFDWRRVYSSGRHLPVEVTEQVLAAWGEHEADVRRHSP